MNAVTLVSFRIHMKTNKRRVIFKRSFLTENIYIEIFGLDDGIPEDKQSKQINSKNNDSNKDGNERCAQEVQSSTSEQSLQGTTIQQGTKTPQTEPSNLPPEVETSSSSPRKERFVSKMRFYSKNEQQQIVDYIINTRSYQYIKGVQIWQEMQKSNEVCNGRRTWQSMKEHFHKQIVPQLHKYKNVSEKTGNFFKRALMGMAIDLDDSDSDEEKENISKKKRSSAKDMCEKETNLTGSESETNEPYKNFKNRTRLKAAKKTQNKGSKGTLHRTPVKNIPTTKSKLSCSIATEDSNEEDDSDYPSKNSRPTSTLNANQQTLADISDDNYTTSKDCYTQNKPIGKR